MQPKLLLSRRGFLISSVFGLVGIPNSFPLSNFWKPAREKLYLTSINNDKSQSFIAAVDVKGKPHFEIPVGARCHATAPDPVRPNRAVVFPKRPGYLSYLVDFEVGTIIKEFRARPGRFFYGHGSYSKDGKYLFATENDYLAKKGVVSIWDGETMQFLGEIPSHGIGPHELKMLDDGKTLVIANGGVFEHPDIGEEKGREKLNVSEMAPSLVYVDAASSKLLGEFRPENHFLGLRHLSIRNDGLVAIAIQNEGPKELPTPLVAFHKGEEQLRLANAPEEILRRMNHYALSVLMEEKSGITCVTCPKGNLVTFWDAEKAEYISSLDIDDAGGVTLSPDERSFLITTGAGEFLTLPINSVKDPNSLVKTNYSDIHYDNHISVSL